MNKYRDALTELKVAKENLYPLVTMHDETGIAGETVSILKNIMPIFEQLVSEKDEQLSRRDKLVVGSEWECVVRCHSSNTFHCVGELVKIGEIEDTFVWLEDSILDTYVNDSQFLLCFKPR